MSELEERIAERLRAGTERAHPPPGLGARIRDAVNRRHRRRRQAAVTGTTLAVAAVIAVPTLIVTSDPGPPPVTSTGSPSPEPTDTPTRAPDPEPPDTAALQDLYQLVDMSTAVTIPRDLPRKGTFEALSLGQSGTVYGHDNDFRRPQDVAQRQEPRDVRLWRAGSERGAPVVADEDVDTWAVSAGNRFVAWAEKRDPQHDYQVMCRRVGDEDRRQLGVRGTFGPIEVDHDIIVWTDASDPAVGDPRDPPRRTVWAASGCRDPRPLPVQGFIEAFSYPDVLVFEIDANEEFTGTVLQVDVETGQTDATHAVPHDMNPDYVELGVNREVLAWADWDDGVLTVTDRQTGRSRRVTAELPQSPGEQRAILTAGDRLIAYWSQPSDDPPWGDPYTAQSLIYDPRTGSTIRLPGDALASGEWLLWSEGRDYRLAQVR